MIDLIHKRGSWLRGDCLDRLGDVRAGSVDMVFADLPYGITAARWDQPIELARLWQHLGRVCKPGAAIVLTATQPFAAELIASRRSWFRVEWIWNKVRPSGFQLAKTRPMRLHENVLVFAAGGARLNYRPEMVERPKPVRGRVYSRSASSPLSGKLDGLVRTYTHKHPTTIVEFCRPTRAIHATEKPVDLVAYFVRTYSARGDLVLDCCAGVATTCIAAIRERRRFVGIERDRNIFNLGKRRIVKEIGK